jgi:hypothetical protein
MRRIVAAIDGVGQQTPAHLRHHTHRSKTVRAEHPTPNGPPDEPAHPHGLETGRGESGGITPAQAVSSRQRKR